MKYARDKRRQKEKERKVAIVCFTAEISSLRLRCKIPGPSFVEMLGKVTLGLLDHIDAKHAQYINLEAFALSAVPLAAETLYELTKVYVPEDGIDSGDFQNHLAAYNVLLHYPFFVNVTDDHNGCEDWNTEYNTTMWKWYMATFV